jgi:hypothetical protein
MNAPRDEIELERRIDRALREQPSRPAPPTLIARVRAEIERRARLPWWRRSVGHWPLGARVAFVALTVGCAQLLRVALGWLPAPADAPALSRVLPRLPLHGVLELVRELTLPLVHVIPRDLVYEGMLVAILLYAVLFALAAVAYRLLYARADARART